MQFRKKKQVKKFHLLIQIMFLHHPWPYTLFFHFFCPECETQFTKFQTIFFHSSKIIWRTKKSVRKKNIMLTFLLPNWWATVWHFSASSTVKVKASNNSVSGYLLFWASSSISFRSEKSSRSSPLASNEDFTLSTHNS